MQAILRFGFPGGDNFHASKPKYNVHTDIFIAPTRHLGVSKHPFRCWTDLRQKKCWRYFCSQAYEIIDNELTMLIPPT